MELTLLLTLTGHDQGDRLMKAARYAGTGGGTVLMGRGQSGNRILDFMALGDEGREILWIIAEKSELPRIKFAIADAASENKKSKGTMMELEVNRFMRSGNPETGGKEMVQDEERKDATHELLAVILNDGYADEVMELFRKNGAAGGTVIKAHGTAKEGDALFFGVEIVPEKEMLLILCEKAKTEEILQALNSLPFWKEQGMGIAFTMDVNHYTSIGGKR
ncbi:MAG: hypothetical protein LBQ96_09040 [Fusobacteriaceae bacterium]|jgi:nitrogen regulatory protein PII|nr:hypothetical protein [Fusobacteriaceae bacterium]